MKIGIRYTLCSSGFVVVDFKTDGAWSRLGRYFSLVAAQREVARKVRNAAAKP